MSLYQTAQGWGIDYRDEYLRRHRQIIGSVEAASAALAAQQTRIRQAKAGVRRFAQGEALT